MRTGDGTLGWSPDAPYDAIIVTAGGPRVPVELIEQLGEGGRLVIPVGPEVTRQTLMRLTRTADGSVAEESLGPCAFVPLVGQRGWPE